MMHRSSVSSSLSAVTLLAVIALAMPGCGGDLTPTSPAFDPPAPGAPSFGTSATAAVSGQLVAGSAASASAGAMPQPAVVGGIQVSVDGTGLTTTTDGTGRFLLVGVPSGNVRLRFVGGGTDANLMVTGIGANQVVSLTIQVQGSGAQVVAENRNEAGEFEGVLAAVDAVAGSFTLVDGTTVFVDPATWWDTGGDIQTFADLALAAQLGQVVELEGRYVSAPNGDLLAIVVKAEVDDAAVKVEGFAVAVNRAAMSITLIDGTVVVIDPLLTEWEADGDYTSFAALATAIEAGMFVEVEVEGSLQDDGAVFAAKIKAKDDPFELDFRPDEWDLGWVGSGSSGNGNSSVDALIDDGPYAFIDGSTVQMEGPGGTVTPIATELDDGRFKAKFTKADAISIVGGAVAGDEVTITVRGALIDGTPFELVGTIEIVDEDDNDDDDGGNNIDPATAAEAIADIREVIAFIQALVETGNMAANNANPLITKLESAIASLQKLNGTPAINQLEAFLNQLEAAEKTGKISEENAETLEEMVEDIIDLLEGD